MYYFLEMIGKILNVIKKTEEQFKKYNISIEWLPYTKGISTTDIKGKIYDTNNK